MNHNVSPKIKDSFTKIYDVGSGECLVCREKFNYIEPLVKDNNVAYHYRYYEQMKERGN